MKLLISLIILMNAVWVNSATPWQVPDAQYRLSVSSSRPNDIGYLDFNLYALPILLSNGIDVRTSDGTRIPFFLHQTLGLIIAPAPQSTKRFIYFGLPEVSPVDQWDKKHGSIPADHRLYGAAFARWHNHMTAQEWLKNQMLVLERRFQARSRWFLNYFASNFLRNPYKIKLPSDWSKPFDNEDFLCWRFRDYSRRVTWFTTQEMATSYVNPYYTASIRLEWAWRMIHQNYLLTYKNSEKLPALSLIRPLKDFQSIFKFTSKRPMKSFFEGNLNSLQITTDSFDSRRNFGIIFDIQLVVPQTGEYEFSFKTETGAGAGAILEVDGKTLITNYCEYQSENPTKIKLESGLRKLKLQFHRDNRPGDLVVSWKKPGDKTTTILSSKNFAPGWPNIPSALQNRDGKNLPLMRRVSSTDIFTEKLKKLNLIEVQAIPEGTELIWFLDGAPVASGSSATMICNPDAKFGASGENYEPTQLFWLGNRYNAESYLHAGALRMQLHTPDFVFDDETQEMFIEAISASPIDTTIQLETSVSASNSMFSNGIKTFVIQAKKTVTEDRFAQDGFYKYAIRLNGSELRSSLNVSLKMKMPGLVFSEKIIRFIPLAELPKLTYDSDGKFYDANGAQIIPVLHRPTLAELRRWELPLLLRDQIIAPNHMLVVADDFGSFSSALTATLSDKNIQTQFLPWQSEYSLIPMRESLPELLPAIKESSCNTALVIPSAFDLRNRVPLRSQIRHLSAVIQALRENQKIKTIYLATPIPQEDNLQAEDSLIVELRRLARDFGLKMINLNFRLRQDETTPEFYQYDNANPSYREILPIKQIPTICEFLAKEITNR